jgi:hypothetical protein
VRVGDRPRTLGFVSTGLVIAMNEVPALPPSTTAPSGAGGWVERAGELIRSLPADEALPVLMASLTRLFAQTEVGVFLMDPTDGSLRSTQFASRSAARLEAVELAHQEGPCVDTARSGRAVLNEELDGAGNRWPTFGPSAQSEGFVLVSSLPMLHDTHTYGVVNLFGRAGAHLDPIPIHTATVLIDGVAST